jgi:hypothetical protein
VQVNAGGHKVYATYISRYVYLKYVQEYRGSFHTYGSVIVRMYGQVIGVCVCVIILKSLNGHLAA